MQMISLQNLDGNDPNEIFDHSDDDEENGSTQNTYITRTYVHYNTTIVLIRT